MTEGKPNRCQRCGSDDPKRRHSRCRDLYHSSPVPAATREIPEEEVDERIQPCGHFAYRAYYDSPTDYGCGGCDNEMEPDALVYVSYAECDRLMTAFAASETAALRAERDKLKEDLLSANSAILSQAELIGKIGEMLEKDKSSVLRPQRCPMCGETSKKEGK